MESKTFSSDPLSDRDIFDPFDMDREEFNPDLCMIRYIRECSLQNLLSRKNHIDIEIRDFSSDLQTLLYDNYGKFINAASVVTNMKTDFHKMEKEIDNLHENMGIVQKTSSEILENLRPTEGKILKLLKFQDIMKRLVSLTDLVHTLKRYMDSGAHNSAARHYLKAKNILEKYKHFQSLGGIVKDCAEIVSEIKSALQEKLNCEIYGKEELCDNLKLLLSLEEEPTNVLEYFLKSSDNCLSCLMTCIEESPTNPEGYTLDEILKYVSSCCSYVEKTSKVVETIKEVSLSRSDLNMGPFANEILEEFFTTNMDRLSIKFNKYIKEKFINIDDDFLSHNLDKFIRQCYISGIITSKINFYNKGMSIILKICVGRCEFLLEKMKGDFSNYIIEQRSYFLIHADVRNLLAFLKDWTEQKLMEVLKSVTVYIRPEFRCCREIIFRKIFCKVIVREGIFIAFFRYISDEVWRLLSSSTLQKPNEVLFCAVLAKYLLDLQQETIPEFLSKVDYYLFSTSEKLCSTTAEDISTEFRNVVLKIIELYIQIRYQNMAKMVKTSIENRNWVKSKEPSRPRAVVKILVKDIREAKEETEEVFGACESPLKKKGSDLGEAMLFKKRSIDILSEPNCIEERMLLNKILSKDSELSSKADSNTPSIMNCLVKRVLKSFIEYARLKTFNHFSLQQIQIDVCYLQSHIYKLLDFSINIQSLLDEILSSTYKRTFSPKLMNDKVISVICGNLQ